LLLIARAVFWGGKKTNPPMASIVVDMTLALNYVSEVEKGVPQKSSSVTNHTFAAQLKTIF